MTKPNPHLNKSQPRSLHKVRFAEKKSVQGWALAMICWKSAYDGKSFNSLNQTRRVSFFFRLRPLTDYNEDFDCIMISGSIGKVSAWLWAYLSVLRN